MGGNSIAVAISNAWYPDTRNVSDNAGKLAIQLATDAFSNVLKEFWPDVKREPGQASAALRTSCLGPYAGPSVSGPSSTQIESKLR